MRTLVAQEKNTPMKGTYSDAKNSCGYCIFFDFLEYYIGWSLWWSPSQRSHLPLPSKPLMQRSSTLVPFIMVIWYLQRLIAPLFWPIFSAWHISPVSVFFEQIYRPESSETMKEDWLIARADGPCENTLFLSADRQIPGIKLLFTPLLSTASIRMPDRGFIVRGRVKLAASGPKAFFCRYNCLTNKLWHFNFLMFTSELWFLRDPLSSLSSACDLCLRWPMRMNSPFSLSYVLVRMALKRMNYSIYFSE